MYTDKQAAIIATLLDKWQNRYRYTNEQTGKPVGYDRSVTYEEEYTTKDEAKMAYLNQLNKAGLTLDKMSLATVPYIGRKLKSGKIKPVFYFREADKNLLLV